jgi:GAF domain-containing protein
MLKTVNLIRDRLGYYHISVFLLDESGQNAIVRESTGEVGQILKERPHTLAVGSQSIIGFVTANRQPRIALDTRADAGHFKNPLLPDTRSEIALPLAVGETLFGALDVQSTQANAFADEDVAVLQNMANQIAIAINNARLFQQAQDRLNEVSLLNRQYLSRAWDTFSQTHPDSVNLQLDGGRVSPAPQLGGSAKTLTITAPTLTDEGRTITIPITLRDQIIGEFMLASPEHERPWQQDDLILVDSIVTQVALAVENARLLEETQMALGEAQRLARRERVISEITTKITYGADVKRILQIAADELRLATGSSRAIVRLTAQSSTDTQEAA